jgi:hypothetical protein
VTDALTTGVTKPTREKKKMSRDNLAECLSIPAPLQHEDGYEERAPPIVADLKARQSAKIQELGFALIAAGIRTLDEQAAVLGLSRSTTWTILKARHKSSGLSAKIINRMLASPQLPPLVRSKIIEYGEEKAAGLYGGSRVRRRRFIARLSVRGVRPVVIPFRLGEGG